MPTPRITVLAGSKAFTSALAGPLAERVGEKPRLAADPGQAFALCRSGSAVLVLEYEPAWASVLKDLARSAAGLRMVAALPPAALEAEPALRALGVRTVRWEGDAAPLLDAVRPAGPSLTPTPGPALTPAPRPALTPAPRPAHTPAPGQSGGFFQDVGAGPTPAASGVPPPALWPATAPGEEDAEHILCSALAGLAAAGDPALDATLAALTPLETEALRSAAPQPDAVSLRRLAALRYRVAFALSTAPAPGSPVDSGGGNLLLTEIDEALPALKGVAEQVPDRAAEIDAIRNALVKEAVDLSEALHRLQPGAAPAPAPAVRDPRRTTGRMRVDAIPEPHAAGRKRTGLWIAFGIATLAAAAFHGWNRFLRPEIAPPPPPFGIPAGMTGADAQGSAGRLVVRKGGEQTSQVDIEAFRTKEEASGRTVREVAPGVYLSTPSGATGGSR